MAEEHWHIVNAAYSYTSLEFFPWSTQFSLNPRKARPKRKANKLIVFVWFGLFILRGFFFCVNWGVNHIQESLEYNITLIFTKLYINVILWAFIISKNLLYILLAHMKDV